MQCKAVVPGSTEARSVWRVSGREREHAHTRETERETERQRERQRDEIETERDVTLMGLRKQGMAVRICDQCPFSTAQWLVYCHAMTCFVRTY